LQNHELGEREREQRKTPRQRKRKE
jgi:hypothetical protein